VYLIGLFQISQASRHGWRSKISPGAVGKTHFFPSVENILPDFFLICSRITKFELFQGDYFEIAVISLFSLPPISVTSTISPTHMQQKYDYKLS
jgi:hypothetical protein